MEDQIKILVAEDEALVAMDIEYGLEDMGVSVVGPCLSLEETLEVVESKEIDAAILDIDLQGKTVFPAAKKLTEIGVPFVFHSGRKDVQQVLDLFPQSKLFCKPTNPSVMLTALEEMLAA